MISTTAPIRCLIVDDEPLAHQVLKQFIAQTPGLVLSGQCRNAMEAHDHLRQHTVDLLFLDIEMPLVTGLNFLRTLQKPPQTILTTAYRDYAYEGFELQVLDYLLKPFSYARFHQAVARYPSPISLPTQLETYLFLKDQGGLLKVPHASIHYVEGCRDYVKVVTTAKTYLHHATLKDMTKQLGEPFVRVHRSFIVSAAYVKLLQPDQVVLSDDTVIPIGQAYKALIGAYFRK